MKKRRQALYKQPAAVLFFLVVSVIPYPGAVSVVVLAKRQEDLVDSAPMGIACLRKAILKWSRSCGR